MTHIKIELPNGDYMEAKTGKKRQRWKNASLEERKKIKARTNRWRSNNPERLMLGCVRNRATKFGIPFNLTIEDIVIPEVCPVLGIPLVRGSGTATANSPSVDRIIPELGYTKGNIIIISYKANAIKSNATPEEILQVAEFFLALKETKKAA